MNKTNKAQMTPQERSKWEDEIACRISFSIFFLAIIFAVITHAQIN